MIQFVIVYGPQGCGKTTNARALADKFQCFEIIDGNASIRLPRQTNQDPRRALVLVNGFPDPMKVPESLFLSFDLAMSMSNNEAFQWVRSAL